MVSNKKSSSECKNFMKGGIFTKETKAYVIACSKGYSIAIIDLIKVVNYRPYVNSL